MCKTHLQKAFKQPKVSGFRKVKKMETKTAASITLVIVVVAAIGAGIYLMMEEEAPEEEVTTIHILAYEDIDWWMPDLLDEYNAETGKNLELDLRRIEYMEQAEVLTSILAAGEPVDFIYCTVSELKSLIRDGAFRDLRDYFDEEFLEEIYSFAVMNTEQTAYAVGSDILPALPYGIMMYGFYYNPTMFENLGIEIPDWIEMTYPEAYTFDEFYAMCEEIEAAGIDPISFHGGETWAYFEVLFLTSGKHVDGDPWLELWKPTIEGTISMDDPVWVDVYEECAYLSQYFTPGFAAETESSAAALFANGTTAMFFDGTWAMRYLTPVLGENFQFGYLPYPYNPNYHGIAWGCATPDFGISTTCSDELAEDIADFFRFLFRDDIIVKASDPAKRPGVGGPPKPTVVSAIKAKDWWEPAQMLDAIVAMSEHARPDPNWAMEGEMWWEMLVGCSNVCTGEWTPEQAVEHNAEIYDEVYG
jgi:ABC-type glycerol-3-phosphate transport system substrate-binding protein